MYMEEIKVGEYVRTKNGYIAKFIHVDNKFGFLEFDKTIWKESYVPRKTISFSAFNKRIVKHSSNIIDLIEVDDVGIMNCYGLLVKKFITKEDILELKLGNYTLLKIVTKEQFAKAEYKP